ncbi:glycosyltransferase [Mucilaginibacter lappiensis]|uniref:Rhamnosyl/mannosyltransferase n=1 Tax=Mucilaginibacter lappiensis TaxID=354630 RepID=A0A841JKG8_9SPHI|nr:glycosyltransferase [Mucilaginibacter lappiensis]MBB6130772.1 rhamnosyl/mannosyltransferase [Mucilaginibacter lappiensis]
MKVLQIGKFYPVRGGVEKVMYDLMIGLSEQGVDSDMLCVAAEDYPCGTIIINLHARLICVPALAKFSATMIAPAMIEKLRKICTNYQIIHIHHPDPMACLALFLSGFKGKVVLHWHSDILKQKLLLKLYKPLQQWLIKRADLIVGTSPVYVADSPFLKKFQKKTDFIPIGIEEINPDQEKVAWIRATFSNKKLIFSLGRLVEYKGYSYLIKAAQYLDGDCVILIGGTGPLKENLQKLIYLLHVEDKVKLLGHVPDEDVPHYYGACDIFCLSSILKTEAFAIVQIEAMSCGKPIISTQIPGSGVSWVNTHEQSGITVEIQNERVLAEAIQLLRSDQKLYQTLKDGARQRFNENFTKRIMIQKSIRLYESLIQKYSSDEQSTLYNIDNLEKQH